MSEPMTPERLAEIRELVQSPYDGLSPATARELFAEVERLREELIRCQDKNLDLLDENQRNADIVADAHRLKPEYDKLREWQKRALTHLLSWHTHGWTRGLEAESVDKLITEAEGL